MKRFVLPLLIIFALDATAQQDSIAKKTILIFGAYADTYYAYYQGSKPGLQQVHNCIGATNRSFGLNVAQVSAEMKHQKIRGKVTLQAGDIPNIAWNGVSVIQEAFGGIKLGKRNWLDLGFFKTHIGAESFLPKDNLLSQLSLATFYGPFYQSGARFVHPFDNGYTLEAHLFNGYNLQIDNNRKPSVGVLVWKEFKPNFKISYSNLFGEEELSLYPAKVLFYNNIYSNFSFGKWHAQISADVATQFGKFDLIKPKNNILIASLATFKREIKSLHSVAFRGEWFYDPSSINSRNFQPEVYLGPGIVPNFLSKLTLNPKGGINIIGATIGYEYKPNELGFLRIESRYLHNLNTSIRQYPAEFDPAKVGLDGYLKNRLGALITIGVYFDKKLIFAS